MEQTMLGLQPPLPLAIDAVHVAVKSLECTVDELAPGTHVNKDGLPRGNTVGIVDPFLRGPVKRGDYFYLCLYPGSITALKHYWTHPAFQPEESDKEESIEWMSKYAKGMDLEASDLMSKLDALYHGGPDYKHFSTQGDYNEELRHDWADICYHYAKVSGNLIPPSDYVSFSCSC